MPVRGQWLGRRSPAAEGRNDEDCMSIPRFQMGREQDMKFKNGLLASASALVLLGAASSAALAQQIQQNQHTPVYDLPSAITLNQLVGPNITNDPASLRVNTIDDGYSDGLTGISHDQQNNGTSNALGIASNVVISTAAPGSGGDVSQQLWLSGATTAGTYTNNNGANQISTFRENTIDNAFNDASGIVDVQQNNGDGNVMGIGDVVSANLGPNFLGQNGENHDDSRQRVRLDATVANVTSQEQNIVNGSDIISERTNTISGGAFTDFTGMASVQQNNGNGNVIQAGNSIVADLGTETDTSDTESSSSSLLANATVTNNSGFAASQSGPPEPYDRTNTVDDAFVGAGGIVNVQQNNGDNNAMNVGNAVRAHFLTADDIDDATKVVVSAVGTVTNNNSQLTTTDSEQNRLNTLTGDAFSDGTGLFAVQQNNGNNNAMNAATGVVATLFTSTELEGNNASAQALASATVTNNRAVETTNVDRVNTIDDGSFNDTAGVATVQQNNGDNNVINASKAIVAGISDNPNFVGFNGSIVNDTAITAVVANNTSIIQPTNVPPGYQNTLSDSFSGFSGIKTVQQNNGSNNAIQSSIAVVANVITP
jgi:hypothetical protein